ncbi:hypothetical protein P171DRAFT_442478 [Karstenula rhodostoma CBS 690.94]|uniref:Uncharacterized protein n=1 Tax=Karstenula rhodostoma CBS 690.94 TaxID=1392251 RepID=A0A9P4PLK9_9PLEO|nr:hypothetical protein P171DRAFT_442478 [Karstenula rhodostoma CBS 690.94]
MWKRFRSNGSSRSSSNASVQAADAHSSPAASVRTTPSPVPRISVRSSKSSQSSQQSSELKDLHELLDFHKSLVQSLGEDLQKRVAELDKVSDLSAKQEQQIDTQQAEIEHLSTQKTDLKRRLAELETQVKENKTRIDELIKGINALRKRNAQSENAGDQIVSLDGIVKDALIDQLESDVERLTQQGLDHDHDMQTLAYSHEHKVSDLHKIMESLRNDLKHERSVVAKYMWDFAEATNLKEAAEDALQQQGIREALSSQGKSSDAAAREKKLTQALSYTRELSESERLVQDGKEVELYHLSNLCGVAQAQEEAISRLRAANTYLLAAHTKMQDEKKNSAAQTNSPPLSHRRNVTWDLPLRNDAPGAPPTLSKVRKRFAIPFPLPLRDPAPHTAPLFSHIDPATPSPPPKPSLTRKLRRSLSFSKSKSPSFPTSQDENETEVHRLRAQLAAARAESLQHEREKEGLQSEVAGLRLQLSENVHVSQELMAVAEEVASQTSSSSSSSSGVIREGRMDTAAVAERMVERYYAVRDGRDGAVQEEQERVLDVEQVEAAEYLFGKMPVVLGVRAGRVDLSVFPSSFARIAVPEVRTMGMMSLDERAPPRPAVAYPPVFEEPICSESSPHPHSEWSIFDTVTGGGWAGG